MFGEWANFNISSETWKNISCNAWRRTSFGSSSVGKYLELWMLYFTVQSFLGPEQLTQKTHYYQHVSYLYINVEHYSCAL